jgi:hypothetical protein
MTTTLIFFAKLFRNGTYVSDMQQQFFAAKNTFCSNFVFLAPTFVAVKNDISCSER